jgi:hypothetical protein
MAIYIEGIERSIEERFTAFGEDLDEIKQSQRRISHLVISCIVAPIIVGVITAVIMKGGF